VAVRSGPVVEAFRPAEDTYRPVTYPAAVIKASRQSALAQAFVDLLVSPDGQATLSRLGFQPAPPGAR
jgi:ABC-type molybdate transport system substrate-binding protein